MLEQVEVISFVLLFDTLGLYGRETVECFMIFFPCLSSFSVLHAARRFWTADKKKCG